MKNLRYIALGLLMAFGVSFAACGDDEQDVIDYTKKPDEEKKEEPKTDEEKMSVFICFGQSNMEGNAPVEDQDRADVPDNFKNMIVANCDVEAYGSKRYTWRKADPPLARKNTGLTPADYFGRKLAAKFPNREIGIVMVAIGGAPIEAFIKETCADYCAQSGHEAWYKSYLNEYDNNPYKVLLAAAKAAQKSGVIRGILLHQGESNNCQQDWPEKVKGVYDNLVADLGLDPTQCPLLVGETLRAEYDGICWGHNAVIATVPNVIPNSYVISSEGCEGKPKDGKKSDGFHFCAEGYRTIGGRYADKMISLMK